MRSRHPSAFCLWLGLTTAIALPTHIAEASEPPSTPREPEPATDAAPPQEARKDESDKNESDKNESDKNESGKNESGKNESGKNESGKNESDQNESGQDEPADTDSSDTPAPDGSSVPPEQAASSAPEEPMTAGEDELLGEDGEPSVSRLAPADPPSKIKEDPVPKTEAEREARDRAHDREEGTLGTLAEPGTVDIQETSPAKEDAPRRRLGPARIILNDRGDRLTFGLATQLQGRLQHTFDSADLDKDTDAGVLIRRLRTVSGSRFFGGRVRSSLQLNITPASLELIDIWVLYAPIRKLAFRIGQFKVPYTRYRAQSFAALSSADWSPITRMFGSERQLGIELLNPNPDTLNWEYAVGVFTGVNARGAHGVGIVDIYGEEPVNRSDLREFHGPENIHPEIIGRVARNFGTIDTNANTDLARGPLRHSLGFSGAWDLRPQYREDHTARMALEWLAKYEGLYINLATHVGWFKQIPHTDFGSWGGMAESGYRFDRHWELIGRFTHIGYSKALREDAAAYAVDQIGDDPDLIPQYGTVGQSRSKNEGVVTTAFYIVGHSLKLQLEAAWRGEVMDFGLRQSLSGFLQLQFQY